MSVSPPGAISKRARRSNIERGDGHAAASINFDAADLWQTFLGGGDNVEGRALNHLIEDRPFDQLCTSSFAEYQCSDNAGRYKAVADNADFAAVCTEFDNQVRNASHHGSMVFDPAMGLVEYQAGKGGKGELRTIGYATYLARTSRLFIQLMPLFRLEILIGPSIWRAHTSVTFGRPSVSSLVWRSSSVERQRRWIPRSATR